MRHRYDSPRLGRSAAHRKAMFANMAASLFIHHKIVTTLGKARYARRFAERMITFARKGDLAARRHVARYIRNPKAVKKLFDELGIHFKNRNGGYTRLIHLGTRQGDGARLALIELVGFDDVVSSTPTKKATKSRLKKAVAEKREGVDVKPERKKSRKTSTKKATKQVEDVIVKSEETVEEAVEETNAEVTAEEAGEDSTDEAKTEEEPDADTNVTVSEGESETTEDSDSSPAETDEETKDQGKENTSD